MYICVTQWSTYRLAWAYHTHLPSLISEYSLPTNTGHIQLHGLPTLLPGTHKLISGEHVEPCLLIRIHPLLVLVMCLHPYGLHTCCSIHTHISGEHVAHVLTSYRKVLCISTSIIVHGPRTKWYICTSWSDSHVSCSVDCCVRLPGWFAHTQIALQHGTASLIKSPFHNTCANAIICAISNVRSSTDSTGVILMVQ